AVQQQQLQQLDEQIATAQAKWNNMQSEVATAQKSWERAMDRSKPLTSGPARGLVAYYPLDGNVAPQTSLLQPNATVSADAANGATPKPPGPDAAAKKTTPPSFVAGRVGQAASFDGKSFIECGDIAGFVSHMDETTVSYDDAYTLSAWIYTTSS